MSETNDLFIKASRSKLRFESTKGNLTVEQLWDLPLTSKDGFNLDAVARTVNGELRELSEDSFVETRANPRKRQLEIALEIVKFVISEKQAENAHRLAAVRRDDERRRIEAALAAKDEAEMVSASREELQARLRSLDNEKIEATA